MDSQQIRSQALDAIKTRWNSLALITFVYACIIGALSFTGVGPVVISGSFTVSLSIISLKAIRREHFELKNLFDGFYNFVNTFLLGLVNTVFVALWSLLFLVPGIIKSLSYSMSYYIIAENPEMSSEEARRESIMMMNGNKMRLFKLQLSFIGWYILSIFTFGILLFWVIPYAQAATAVFYEDIKPRFKIPYLEVDENPPSDN